MIRLDTHVAVWLRAGDKRLRPIRAVLERDDLRLSPFVVLELQAGCGRRAGGLLSASQRTTQFSFTMVGSEKWPRALDVSFTRDPYDRLIAADFSSRRLRHRHDRRRRPRTP